MSALARLSCLFAAATLAACGTVPPAAPVSAPAPARASVTALYRQPAERALIQGIALYDLASFEPAEVALRDALRAGLGDPRDVATAHKYIAFIECAFNRLPSCEQEFREAFGADPSFALSEVEVGHPVWGPVYLRVRNGRLPQK